MHFTTVRSWIPKIGDVGSWLLTGFCTTNDAGLPTEILLQRGQLNLFGALDREVMSMCERCWQSQRYSLEILIHFRNSYGLPKNFFALYASSRMQDPGGPGLKDDKNAMD